MGEAPVCRTDVGIENKDESLRRTGGILLQTGAVGQIELVSAGED